MKRSKGRHEIKNSHLQPSVGITTSATRISKHDPRDQDNYKEKIKWKERNEKTMVLFNWKDWRRCVCGRREGRGGEEEEEVSHCYWCVLYCLSKYSGSFILSLREPSPLNINIMPLKARIMWGNWDYLPIRRLAELLFACLEETLPKDSYCIREKMGNICLRNFIKRMEGLFIFYASSLKFRLSLKETLAKCL